MSIVITTPTGNIGRTVAETLLSGGRRDITVIARDRGKVSDLEARGAVVFEGSHADAEVMKRATEGARALFCLTPPDMMTDDVRGHAAVFGEAAAAAIRSNQIPYVVYNSGIGADLSGHDAEPLYSLQDNEQRYAAETPNLISGRPAWFMENLLGQADDLRHRWRYWPSWPGLLFSSFKPDTPVPMIATGDIGVRYATLLADLGWSGHQVVELHGPGPVTHAEIASTLEESLGRSVRCLTVSKSQFVDALTRSGVASAHMAAGFFEMSRELEEGRMQFHEAPNEFNTTPTTFAEFAVGAMAARVNAQ